MAYVDAFKAGVILLPQHHANDAHGGGMAWRDVRGFFASFDLVGHDHLKAVVKFEQYLVFHYLVNLDPHTAFINFALRVFSCCLK